MYKGRFEVYHTQQI